MGNSTLAPQTRQQMLQTYSIISINQAEGTSLLQHKQTECEFILRQMVLANQDTLNTKVSFFQKRQAIVNNCNHLCHLERIIADSQNQLCRTYHKAHMLMEMPGRTLAHQIKARTSSNCRFEQKDLWGLIAACIVALSHLQRASISHQQLSSQTILLTPQGNVKLYDPVLVGTPTNYEQAFDHKFTGGLYLSPELTRALRQQEVSPQCNPYKSDVFTLGVIILEAALAHSQSKGYNRSKSTIEWSQLTSEIYSLRNQYSEELFALVSLMLLESEAERLDWQALEDKLMQNTALSLPTQQFSNGQNQIEQAQQESLKTASPYLQLPPLRGHSHIHQSIIKRVNPSNINSSRPFRNLFPLPEYQNITHIDQDIQAIPRDPSTPVIRPPLLTPPETQSPHFGTSPISSNRLKFQEPQLLEYVCERYQLGSEYRGEKWKDMRHGFGVFQYQGGGLYEGQWRLDNMQGKGRLYYPSGKIAYDGQWLNDQFHGKGILYNEMPVKLTGSLNYQNLDLAQECWVHYEGQFKNDLKCGTGLMTFSNGEWFEGHFMDDIANGYGCFHRLNGQTVSGQWRKNQLF